METGDSDTLVPWDSIVTRPTTQTVHKESEVQGKGVKTSAFKRLSDLDLTTV